MKVSATRQEGLNVRSGRVRLPKWPLVRFLGLARAHLQLVIGAALMGVGKFTLPLAFPLAFKYVIDVLLAPAQKIGGIDLIIDRWCVGLSNFFGLVPDPQTKLAILSVALLTLYSIQSVASYYRNYW